MPNTPKLIVTVDTEEEGLWGGKYPVRDCSTANLAGLSRFQETCQSMGVCPTYVIDAPVLGNAKAVAELKRWWHDDWCEIGTHCHPWCNPPIVEDNPSSRTSYLCNLPEELQFEKLSWLTDAISSAFERRPTSYRAGRYGFDATSARILSELDYLVDSSILPLHDYRAQSGPDFRYGNPSPYFYDNNGRKLLEIPITAGFTRGDFEIQRNRWVGLRQKPFSGLRLAGVADRLNLVRRLKLSPEGTRLSDLKKLVDQSVKQGRNILVLMLHSTSLVPGYSPYAKTPELLELLYDRLVSVMRYAIDEHRAEPMTLTRAASQLIVDAFPLDVCHIHDAVP